MTRASRLSRRIAGALALLAGSVAQPGLAQNAPATWFEADVSVRPIHAFRIGRTDTRFGALEFAGGLEMVSGERHFGALSALYVAPDQSALIALADTGFWLKGRLVRDFDGNIAGIERVAMRELSNPDGSAMIEKWASDAESITAWQGGLAISFERQHRIETHDLTDNNEPVGIPLTLFPAPVPSNELRHNRGFEALAASPMLPALGGAALIGISEKSLDTRGNLMAFAQAADGRSFQFSVLRSDGFDATGADVLPNGNLVLLERRFTVDTGIAMRLREIAIETLQPGATVDGTILLEADMRYQIDNMEGLSITVDSDGTPRLTLISDDNHSLLQRNLILEFRYPQPADAARLQP